VIVHIPTPLRSYTDAAQVDARGGTLGDLLHDLDRKYPGLRFRIIDEHDRLRQHIKLYLDETACEDLAAPVASAQAVHIICALSGG